MFSIYAGPEGTRSVVDTDPLTRKYRTSMYVVFLTQFWLRINKNVFFTPWELGESSALHAATYYNKI